MFYAGPGQDGTHSRELRTNHYKGSQPENEKGGWCKPPSSLRTDPPKPDTQSRLGSGHPGKPIFFDSVIVKESKPCASVSPEIHNQAFA
jgi:hypothetical protein